MQGEYPPPLGEPSESPVFWLCQKSYGVTFAVTKVKKHYILDLEKSWKAGLAMGRISMPQGKGSQMHNRRDYEKYGLEIPNNIDPTQMHLNVTLVDKDIRKAYKEIFGDSVERYNSRQSREDRKIEDYYEKICSGKQEKPFHELVIQIGNKDDTGSTTEIGEMAKGMLDEYFRDFRERNPNLHVFSAHLHMDEATPHIHIDFVPVISGSSRGLDTRVSLKKALEAQGFCGGTRSATEWNLWYSQKRNSSPGSWKDMASNGSRKGPMNNI